jgi:GNAT superfamily N-acetyltransferase
MAKIKIRRINREELPGIAVLRDAVAADLEAFPSHHGVLDLEMEIDPDLRHLLVHDPDGFFTAYEGQETLGFAASIVRSRQCILSELWVLLQHQGRGAGDALLSRALAYGEHSGARQFLALVPCEPSIQALLLKHGFSPSTPVYLLSLSSDEAARLGTNLSRLLPGMEITQELMNRRGQADIDRLDRLTRNIARDVDHEFWLKERRQRVAAVRQGERIAAYAYGGATIGPIAGSTQDAALSAIGWGLQLSLDGGDSGRLELRIPAPFQPAIEAVLEGGGRLDATLMLYTKGISLAFDRLAFGPLCLP